MLFFTTVYVVLQLQVLYQNTTTVARSSQPVVPIQEEILSQVIRNIDSSNPKELALIDILQDGGVEPLFIRDRRSIVIRESDWVKGFSVLRNHGVRATPPHVPILCQLEYSEGESRRICDGQWESLYWEAIRQARDGEQLPAAIAKLNDAHFHLECQAAKRKLPTAEEWSDLSEGMSRNEQIRYLADRVVLSEATLTSNRLVIPASIHSMFTILYRGGDFSVPSEMVRANIDPFTELFRLELQKKDIVALSPYFSADLTFVPTESAPTADVRFGPCSRYCFCTLINASIRRANAIREYELNDSEWQNPAHVAKFIEEKWNKSIHVEDNK